MAIRITGMYSGLDTESIIDQLASAQSYKKTKLVKEQKRLSWKQDAWKSLNTKLYSFYQKLDDLRLQGSYMKKKTISSNPNAVSVVSNGNAVDGIQSISVTDLARSGYLTGGELKTTSGGKVTGSTTLEQLGFADSGSISVNTGNGSSVKIDVTKDMTVDQFVNQLKNAGLNASFDANYGRMYVSSKETGELANFTLSGDNEAGMNALAALGLLTKDEIDKGVEEGGVYHTWAGYMSDPTDPSTRTQPYKDLIDAEIAKRAAAYKAENDKLNETNEALKKKNDEAQAAYEKDYPDATETLADVDKLRKSLYGYDEDQTVDGETKKVHVEGDLEKKVNDTKKELEEAQKQLKALKANGSTATADDIAKAEKTVAEKSQAATEAKNEFNTVKGKYSYLNSIEENNKKIKENEGKITANESKFNVDGDGKVTGTAALRTDVETEFDAKVAGAKQIIANKDTYKATGKKIDGTDAVIVLNGVEYTSKSSSFEINGMTITALDKTDSPVTLSTTTDTDGIYDMIKGLFTEYNKLINEMDAMYNADAAKGYDPLTSEEKEALSDDEIEEWEKKVKDSLLRRDASLNSVASAMKDVMLQGIEVGGKTLYLSDFGINTLGYFKAADNEKNAYHIDGDADDTSSSGNKDILKSLIASDPDTVMNFFTKLSNNMHDKLQEKMAAVKDTSSALTFYNDKLLKKEYDEYTDKIKKQEDKVNALMDKWYAKFSAMETAMAKLQSKNNAIAGMLGGGS
ncbi:MAG: flagellar filament capping protein FliD [Lachnospiraceae bacterium]|nr:flagellar filament capping protein FliD [Lachnospiraceae bacterium]